MKKLLLVFASAFAGSLFAVLLFGLVSGNAGGAPASDQRFCADANGDGELNVADAVNLLNYLFTAEATPWCIAQEVSLDDVEARLDDLASRMEAVESSTARAAVIATGDYTGTGRDGHRIETGLGSPIKLVRIWAQFDGGIESFTGNIVKTDKMPGGLGASIDDLELDGDAFILRSGNSPANAPGTRYTWVAFAGSIP